jgi:hypothetical protein
LAAFGSKDYQAKAVEGFALVRGEWHEIRRIAVVRRYYLTAAFNSE